MDGLNQNQGDAPDHLRHILIIEDEASMSTVYEDFFTDMGYIPRIAKTGMEALDLLFKEDFSVVVSDLILPDQHGLDIFRKVKKHKLEKVSPAWVIITGHASFNNAVEVIKEGVDHYFEKPIDLRELEIFVSRCVESYKTRFQNWRYRNREKKQVIQDRLIGHSRQFREMLSIAKIAAASEATILIRGESGTGKELVAELIHSISPRSGEPFIKVNCAAIPESLLEAELFGYEKGAFTDAHKRRKGKFELANSGTIFLDEIGDMTPNLQVKILRVLQERELERLGGNETIPLDIRLVAATNCDLEEKIKTGHFREDLYYRINVITINIPSLRERARADILLLVSHFLRKFNSKNKKLFTVIAQETQNLLARYKWPGNVRELENVIERAVVLGTGTELLPLHLPPTIREQQAVDEDVIDKILEQNMYLELVEKELIKRALERSKGNVSMAARKLGLTRRTLQYRMKDKKYKHKDGEKLSDVRN
jgi:DNA-binding NtrC family response regulator